MGVIERRLTVFKNRNYGTVNLSIQTIINILVSNFRRPSKHYRLILPLHNSTKRTKKSFLLRKNKLVLYKKKLSSNDTSVFK